MYVRWERRARILLFQVQLPYCQRDFVCPFPDGRLNSSLYIFDIDFSFFLAPPEGFYFRALEFYTSNCPFAFKRCNLGEKMWADKLTLEFTSRLSSPSVTLGRFCLQWSVCLSGPYRESCCTTVNSGGSISARLIVWHPPCCFVCSSRGESCWWHCSGSRAAQPALAWILCPVVRQARMASLPSKGTRACRRAQHTPTNAHTSSPVLDVVIHLSL